jgi:hypothetical protein
VFRPNDEFQLFLDRQGKALNQQAFAGAEESFLQLDDLVPIGGGVKRLATFGGGLLWKVGKHVVRRAPRKLRTGAAAFMLGTAESRAIARALPDEVPYLLRRPGGELGEDVVEKAGTTAATEAPAAAAVRAADVQALSGVSQAEREALDRLDDAAWQRIEAYATANSSEHSIKGVIAEEVFHKSPKLDAVRAGALEMAEKRGIPKSTVRFERSVRGQAPRETDAGGTGELGDGMFVAEHDGKLHVLAVIESKSPSNAGELARKVTDGESEMLGQLEWDLERMRQVPTIVGGKVFQPRNVVVSRNQTVWVGVTPPDKGLAKKSLGSIGKGLPGFQFQRGDVRDKVLNELARRVRSRRSGQ